MSLNRSAIRASGIHPFALTMGILATTAAQAVPEPTLHTTIQVGTGRETAIMAVAVDPVDPQMVVTVLNTGEISKWDVETHTAAWRSMWSPEGPTQAQTLYAAEISPTGRFVAVCQVFSGRAKVYSYATGALLRELTRESTNAGRDHDCRDMIFSPDERSVLVTDTHNLVRYDIESGFRDLDYRWGRHFDGAGYSADGLKIFSLGDTINVWNAVNGDPLAERLLTIPDYGQHYQYDTSRGYVHPSGRWGAIGIRKGQGDTQKYALALIDLELGGPTHVLETESNLETIWMSADGSKVQAFDLAGNWYAWDTESGVQLWRLQKSPWFESGFVWFATVRFPHAYALEGRTFYTADTQARLRVWSLAPLESAE